MFTRRKGKLREPNANDYSALNLCVHHHACDTSPLLGKVMTCFVLCPALPPGRPAPSTRGVAPVPLIPCPIKMCEPVQKSTRLVAPDGFVAPEPRIGLPGPSLMWRIGPAALANILRAGTGKFVTGYTVRSTNGRLVESSTVLPDMRPPRPFVLYEVETSAACRKIREALCLLDLDVIVRPCPVGGTAFREYLTTTLGKLRLPYLVDPNSGFAEHDVTRIINYLFATYGGDISSAPFVLGPVGGISQTCRG
jgi:Glutathione S-transferase, N-terminal domain